MKILRSLFAISAIVLPLLQPALRAAPDTVMPVFKTGATILFVGDSITDGGRARKGSDYNHTMGQGYAFILAAQLGNRFAERNLTFINRGISGNRVPDLQPRWKTDVLDLKPDVLSILVGINDTTRANMVTTAEQFESGYDQLLADTLKTLPGVRIILCEPFVLPSGPYKAAFPAVRAEVQKRQDAVARLATKYKLPLVRFQQAYDDACKRAPAEHWCWDGIHPHYAGHALMADAWLQTVAALR